MNGFEKDLEEFVNQAGGDPSTLRQAQGSQGSGTAPSVGKRVVALSAGTAAVHLGLLNCGVKPGDEVIVQSFTFCASTHPVTYLGATPVLVDSEPDTWNIDPELLEEAIKDRIAKTGKKPAAIVPVALYGMPYKADRIMEIANKRLRISTGFLWWRMRLRALALATKDRCWALSVSMVCSRSMATR